jgi:hypothetical protein
MVELSVSYASDKSVPFARCEPEHRAIRVLAVPNADLASRQAGHLDAVAIGETQTALDPVRI